LIGAGCLADLQEKSYRELNHRMIWQKVLRFGVAVVVAMFLAYLTEVFVRHYSTTLTFAMPGQYVADRVVPVPPPPNEFSTIGEKLLVAFAVDSACYLVLILGLSAIVRKSRDKPGN
jgi:hypothetical protein